MISFSSCTGESNHNGLPNRRQVSVLCGGSAQPQGDRKGPHAAPRHTRPYKDYEEG